jgi:hypothetical protein
VRHGVPESVQLSIGACTAGQFFTRRRCWVCRILDAMNTNSMSPNSTADALATELAGVEDAFNRAMVSNDVLRPDAFDSGCGTIERSTHVGASAQRLLVRRNALPAGGRSHTANPRSAEDGAVCGGRILNPKKARSQIIGGLVMVSGWPLRGYLTDWPPRDDEPWETR